MTDDLVVGRIVGVFGVRGELKVSPSDADALVVGAQLIVRPKNGRDVSAIIETVRRHSERELVLRLRGIDRVEAARMLQGALLLAPRTSLAAMPEGSYRHADLVGMEVIDARRGRLGKVESVRRYPSSDMLVVGDRQALVPLLRAYGVKVDIGRRRIDVDLPDGFDDLA